MGLTEYEQGKKDGATQGALVALGFAVLLSFDILPGDELIAGSIGIGLALWAWSIDDFELGNPMVLCNPGPGTNDPTPDDNDDPNDDGGGVVWAVSGEDNLPQGIALAGNLSSPTMGERKTRKIVDPRVKGSARRQLLRLAQSRIGVAPSGLSPLGAEVAASTAALATAARASLYCSGVYRSALKAGHETCASEARRAGPALLAQLKSAQTTLSYSIEEFAWDLSRRGVTGAVTRHQLEALKEEMLHSSRLPKTGRASATFLGLDDVEERGAIHELTRPTLRYLPEAVDGLDGLMLCASKLRSFDLDTSPLVPQWLRG